MGGKEETWEHDLKPNATAKEPSLVLQGREESLPNVLLPDLQSSCNYADSLAHPSCAQLGQH